MSSTENEWTLSKEIAINKGIIGMVLCNRPVYTFLHIAYSIRLGSSSVGLFFISKKEKL